MHDQDNWEGLYQTVRVACHDYTQVREQAASDTPSHWATERLFFPGAEKTLAPGCYTNLA